VERVGAGFRVEKAGHCIELAEIECESFHD
jgi:hypothetical protein